MTPISDLQAARELSPEAQAAAGWFRQLARTLRVFRLYRGDNPVVGQMQEAITASLCELLATQGGWTLRFSATEIDLGDEPIVKVQAREPGQERLVNVVDQLPFFFYRDGIRRIVLLPGAPRNEVESFVQCLRLASQGVDRQDDLVTLLWQSNLLHLRLEAVPLEQTIYLSAQAGGGRPGAHEKRGQVYAWSPSGSEIRADLGQLAGAQGLHRDTFDDWELPEGPADVPTAYARLLPGSDEARAVFLAGWNREREREWMAQVQEFVRGMLALEDSEDMRRALVRLATTWLASALQDVDWEQAVRALELVHEIDPGRTIGAADLGGALAGLDTGAIAERLDESDAVEHSRFAALVVAMGPPAVGFCAGIMADASKQRARAAAVTALCYLCAENPELLAPWLLDSRWHVVRNVVFILGHIGGSAVVPLLRVVARHPEPRVRRQLVSALGAAPAAERNPLLLEQLDTRDPQLLAAALNMLVRERDPQIARAILGCIEAPDFESRDERNQRALFAALAELADDRAVPALEALLNKGGWFARRTFQRSAAARTLARIGTEQALGALEAGLRARSEAVRAACLEALGTRSRP